MAISVSDMTWTDLTMATVIMYNMSMMIRAVSPSSPTMTIATLPGYGGTYEYVNFSFNGPEIASVVLAVIYAPEVIPVVAAAVFAAA